MSTEHEWQTVVMPSPLNRMIYIDDSGHPQSGVVVYGWIEFSPDRWNEVLRTWLDTRKLLWREYRIPVTTELHTTNYVNGRGMISKRPPERFIENGQVLWKDLGREVAERCLESIGSCEGLSAGAVWRRGNPKDIHRTKQASYEALVARFERELLEEDSLGLVFIDGDGSDATFRTAHRGLKLSDRRLIEDAIPTDSKTSQLVQMADLVAWSAHAFVDHYPKGEFAWNWYSTYLATRDRRRQPQEI